jgi:hypothetical protein
MQSGSPAPPPPRFPEFPRRTPGSPIAWEPKIVIEGKANTALSESETGIEESEGENQIAPIFREFEGPSEEEVDFGQISMEERREITGEDRPPRFSEGISEPDLETPSILRRRRDLF